MKTIVRFLILCLMMLGLLLGQGLVLAEACVCPDRLPQTHSCCQKMASCKHQQTKASSLKSCVCSSDTHQLAINPLPASSFEHLPLFLIATLVFVTLGLGSASRQPPIWLRRLFYPDKGRLYLEKQALLL